MERGGEKLSDKDQQRCFPPFRLNADTEHWTLETYIILQLFCWCLTGLARALITKKRTSKLGMDSIDSLNHHLEQGWEQQPQQHPPPVAVVECWEDIPDRDPPLRPPTPPYLVVFQHILRHLTKFYYFLLKSAIFCKRPIVAKSLKL